MSSPGTAGLELWDLVVDETILGTSPGSSIRVGRSGADPVGTTWLPGAEGIYSLVPVPVGTTAARDVWLLPFGSGGVIMENLDQVAEAFSDASAALGVMWIPNHVNRDSVASALDTDVAVEGTIESIFNDGQSLDVPLSKIVFSDTVVKWAPSGLEGEAEAPTFNDTNEFSEVRLPTEWAQSLTAGSRVTLLLTISSFPGSDEPTWTPVSDDFGVREAGKSSEDVSSEIATSVSQRDTRILALREEAGNSLAPPIAEWGPIPLSIDTETAVEAPDFDAIHRLPIVVELVDVTITFDNWFMVLFDTTAHVTVVNEEGNTLVRGPIFGDDAVMRESKEGVFEFVTPDGTVVASMAQQDLSTAMDLAIDSGPTVLRPPYRD